MSPAVPEPNARTTPKPADQDGGPTAAVPKLEAGGEWASREAVLEALVELL